MHINPINYQLQRTQPNFQAKIIIANEETKKQIIRDDNRSRYSPNQVSNLLDKFEKFKPNKTILIDFGNYGCQYRIRNTDNNEETYVEIQPLYDILTGLMEKTRKNEVFWDGNVQRIFKHKVFIKD